MQLTEWPQQCAITLQPQAKATWRICYARATAVSLQGEMENMLHRQEGTLPFPFPAIPPTNTEWHTAGCCSSWTSFHTERTHREHLSSPAVVLITETQFFTRSFSLFAFLFPLIGKSKLALSWQICLSKDNVASSNTVPQKMIRVSAKELKQLPQKVRTNPILTDSHAVQQDCGNPRTQNNYHNFATALAEWIQQSVVQLEFRKIRSQSPKVIHCFQRNSCLSHRIEIAWLLLDFCFSEEYSHSFS